MQLWNMSSTAVVRRPVSLSGVEPHLHRAAPGFLSCPDTGFFWLFSKKAGNFLSSSFGMYVRLLLLMRSAQDGVKLGPRASPHHVRRRSGGL